MTTEAATPATQTTRGPVETPILDGVIEGMAWLILGIAPLLINVYNVDAYRTIQASYTSIFIVILVAAWAVSVTLAGRWGEIRKMPLLVPLALFGIWALAFLATSPSKPVSGASWVNYALYCLFFFALADLGSRKSDFVWRLSIPLFLAFSFNTVTGLMQHKGFLFLGTEAAGYTGLYQWWPIKTGGMANYFAGLQAPSRLHSAAGTLGNQNVLGGYLCATIPFFLILPAIVMASWRKLADTLLRRYKQMSEGMANGMVGLLAGVLTLNAVVGLAALMATDTRGAWLGVALSLALGVAVVPAFFREQLGRIPGRTWARLAIGGVIGLVAIGGLMYSAGVTPEKMQAKLMGTWTIKQRLVAWQVATKMADEKPIIGQGLGTYKINYFRYLAKVYEGKPIPEYMHHRYVQAHNDFVQLAGEMGWAGLAGGVTVLGLFWFSIPRYLWRRRPIPTEGLLVLSALLGTFGMAAFAISGFPFHIAASSAAWTAIAAMAGASLYRERREAYLAAQAAAPSQGPGLPLEARWALTGALCVFAVSLMAFIYLPYQADVYTKEGMELYKQTKFKEAGEVLQKAIVLDPERGDARLVMGIVLAMLNRFPEAEAQFIRCQTSYDDVTLHYYLGRIYEAMQRPEDARREYRKALSYFPEGTDVRRVVKERLAVLEGQPTGSVAAASASAATTATASATASR